MLHHINLGELERVAAAHDLLRGAVLPILKTEASLRRTLFALMAPSRRITAFFSALILVFSVFCASAQEGRDDSDAVYVIEEIEFSIDGATRPFALMIHGEFEIGRRLRGRESLLEYLSLKEQLLLNQRVFEEVRVDYAVGESREDGSLPVRLLVSARDSWNFIVVPVPRYSTSDGFNISLIARHYNFLGTMSTLGADFGYGQRGGDRGFNFSIESAAPFQAAGLTWTLTFNHFFNYVFGQPLFYQNVTGLAVRIPWRSAALDLGFAQYLTFNEEPGPEAAMYGMTARYAPYGATEVFAAHRIPLGIEAGGFGQVSYAARLSARFNYSRERMDEVRKPSVTASHSIGFGRIDWIGNFRRGLSASVENSFTWYFGRDDAPFRAAVDGDIRFHWPLAEFLGLSSRLRYRQWWHWSDAMNDGEGGWIPHFNAGDALRGVLDSNVWRTRESDLQADRMLSLNIDAPIRVLVFQPSQWLGRRSLRIFDFEMHASPFMDMALLQGPFNNLNRDPHEGIRFRPAEMITTAGLELIAFSGLFRSLQIRASVGYNMGSFRGLSRWDEIYIGTSFHY
ncbi:MAG: hypothetical protein FWC65_05300 [Treponema sp.]|nr:hypothetical protein [Treponema sp.]